MPSSSLLVPKLSLGTRKEEKPKLYFPKPLQNSDLSLFLLNLDKALLPATKRQSHLLGRGLIKYFGAKQSGLFVSTFAPIFS
jgi:hypothetical protein